MQQNQFEIPKLCRAGKRVNHCYFRTVISTGCIPFSSDHSCVQLHLRPPWKHRDRFTAVTPFAKAVVPPSLVKSPRIHHGRAVSILQLARSLYLVDLDGTTGYFSLRNVEKGGKYSKWVGELVWDRSMSPCQGYDARLDRKRSDERRNRVEVFWLLARLEIPLLLLLLLVEAIELSGSSRDSTDRGIQYKCQMLIIPWETLSFEPTVKRNIM